MQLWPAQDDGVSQSGDRPVPLIWWEEDDAQLIQRMVTFCPRRTPRLILDATVNTGRFRRNSGLPVIGIGLESSHRPSVVADNRQMPFADETFDIGVYGPPHVPNQGKDRSKDFHGRYGLAFKSPAARGCNFSHLYPLFREEAHRVLAPEGLVLARIADCVHGHRFPWAHLEFVTAGARAGIMPCDCIVKIGRGPIICHAGETPITPAAGIGTGSWSANHPSASSPACWHSAGSAIHLVGRRHDSFRTATGRKRALCGAAALRSGPSLARGLLKEPPATDPVHRVSRSRMVTGGSGP